jgi:acetyl-CoA synthetase
MSYNCLDRHVKTNRRNKAAIIWESESGESKVLTYQLLFTQVCKFANVLKNIGVQKGDYIVIYMGVVPETIIAMLACARIGAVHSVVYCELSSKALGERISKLDCRLIITQDFINKKGNRIPIKSKVDEAIVNNNSVEKVIVLGRSKEYEIKINAEKDIFFQEAIDKAAEICEPSELDSQHPLFGLFINGSRGDLINIIHATGGYMVQSYLTAKWIFDLKDNDIFWSASDIAWISGHTYGVYGSLLNGATTFLYEGVPIYPEPDRYWRLISKYRINILYLEPTTIRALYKLGNDWLIKHDLSSLRLLGTKGEPIKPETWLWYYENVGKRNCPIVDTWLQTETGTILISPLPGTVELMPGFTGGPFPGIEFDVVDLKGESVEVGDGGYLIIKDSWPSAFTLDKGEKNEAKFNCWNIIKGNYFTGDAALKGKHGTIKILGRVDEVIKAAGNRISGFEIERILKEHPSIIDAAVVKRPDEIIGNAIIAFVVLNGVEGTPLLKEELRNFVAGNIGLIAKPDELLYLPEFPKLKDGKVDRALLREKAREGVQDTKGEDAEYNTILERLREEYQNKYSV